MGTFWWDTGLGDRKVSEINATPVGYIRSEITDRGQAPRQGRDDATVAMIEILPRYSHALEGIEQRSQLVVICWLHLADRDTLTVRPRGDTNAPLTGVFCTRSPARPNPLAIYVCDLVSKEGRFLKVRGIDAVEGTPVLDIKPHIPRLDD